MTESLDRAAQMAGTVSDSIDGHMGALRPMVESMRGQWEGTARIAFERAHASWEEGVARLSRALRDLGGNVGVTSVNYLETDAASTAPFDQAAGLGITSALRG